eukprot:snap_masked-scaffold_69-processed-gene-0.30-mRNA-1 protein AED:1.00 eAED:1.00 QI:0/-1/0/0/-1/1/1/0/261
MGSDEIKKQRSRWQSKTRTLFYILSIVPVFVFCYKNLFPIVKYYNNVLSSNQIRTKQLFTLLQKQRDFTEELKSGYLEKIELEKRLKVSKYKGGKILEDYYTLKAEFDKLSEENDFLRRENSKLELLVEVKANSLDKMNTTYFQVFKQLNQKISFLESTTVTTGITTSQVSNYLPLETSAKSCRKDNNFFLFNFRREADPEGGFFSLQTTSARECRLACIQYGDECTVWVYSKEDEENRCILFKEWSEPIQDNCCITGSIC